MPKPLERAFPGPMDNLCPQCAAMLPRDLAELQDNHGMNLLTYFAARAPHEPQWDFKVSVPAERPEPIWKDMHGNIVPAMQSRDPYPRNRREMEAWDEEQRIQRLAQWPWEWARRVLDAGRAFDL